MTSRPSNDFGAPVGINSAYLETYQRGKERVEQVAETAVQEFDTLIAELKENIGKQYRAGNYEKAQGLEKTLKRTEKSRDKAIRQRDKMLRRMDRQWSNASKGEIDEQGLKELKAIFYGDFLDYQGGLVRKIMRINLSALVNTNAEDRQELPHLNQLMAQSTRSKIEKFLDQAKLPEFEKIEGVVSDGKSSVKSTSVITPVSQLEGQLVPKLEETPMLPSSRRADAKEVVNFHTSSYIRGQSVLAEDLNRSAVLAVSRSKFPDYQDVNKRKVEQLFQVELSQQLLRTERFEELEGIRRAVRDPQNNLRAVGGIRVLNVPTVEIDHLTISLLTLAGKERKMFMDEQKAMMSFHNQTHYFKLEIDGEEVLVPAKFNVHMMNTGVAEISTRDLESDGFSLKGLIGSIVKLVTKMDIVQKKLNKQTWKMMQNNFPAYEQRTVEKMDRFKELSREAYARGDQAEGAKWNHAAARLGVDLFKAKKLKEQIEAAGGPENYEKVTGNPYAVGARVIVLAQYMGYSVHWHCKSGKDRTGMMDIEVKYLLEMMHRGYRKDPGKFKPPPIELREEKPHAQRIRGRIALRGGNMELARANTGEHGLKTVKRKENTMRYGKRVAEILSGHSDRVSS